MKMPARPYPAGEAIWMNKNLLAALHGAASQLEVFC
jgi:hypothetical protein